MKKLFVLIIALSLTGGGLVATVASYPVSVNGETLNVTVLNHNGTTYLPLKAVGQALGADVTWTGKSVEVNTVDVEELKKACVSILAQNPKNGMQGSGVYVDYDEILTAQHVVNGMDRFTVNGYADLKLENLSKDVDAAILETKHKEKPVKIGDSDEVEVGDRVVAVSAQGNIEDTITDATVKAIEYVNRPDSSGGMHIVLNVALGEGASGCAIFDMNGCLVGMASMAESSINETYIIPINQIREAL